MSLSASINLRRQHTLINDRYFCLKIVSVPTDCRPLIAGGGGARVVGNGLINASRTISLRKVDILDKHNITERL